MCTTKMSRSLNENIDIIDFGFSFRVLKTKQIL